MIDVMHVQRDRNAKIRTKFVVNLYIDLHNLNFIILDSSRFFGLGLRMYVEMYNKRSSKQKHYWVIH